MTIIFLLAIFYFAFKFFNKAIALSNLCKGAKANFEEAISKRECVIERIASIAESGSSREKQFYESIADKKIQFLNGPRFYSDRFPDAKTFSMLFSLQMKQLQEIEILILEKRSAFIKAVQLNNTYLAALPWAFFNLVFRFKSFSYS